MAYKDQWLIAADTDFVHSVTIAAVDVCRDIAGEAPATVNHANRVALMKSVLAQPNEWGTRMAVGVAMLGGTNASTDAQIKTFVSQVWNAYSGV